MQKILIFGIFFLLVFPFCAQNPTFSSVNSACVNETIQFTNTSASGLSYIWKLNGNTVSSNYNYTHTFNAPNSYVITLVADSNGIKDSISKTIQINHKPSADFHVQLLNADVAENVTFSNNVPKILL